MGIILKLKGPLIKGTFIDRPNRFLTNVRIGETIVASHLPDPGRLNEILYPGVTVFLREADDTTNRSTNFSTVLVKVGEIIVSLDTTLPNRLVKNLLIDQELSFLKDFTFEKQEISVGKHRIDFLLRGKNSRLFYLEVKSVTYVSNHIARFPDAVTIRGAKHMEVLAKLAAQKNTEAGVLFICQRPDAEEFRPMWDRDPAFGKALTKAYNSGVRAWCITTHVSLEDISVFTEIPVNLKSKP
jgi:sugar fermentation stimulation protein A